MAQYIGGHSVRQDDANTTLLLPNLRKTMGKPTIIIQQDNYQCHLENDIGTNLCMMRVTSLSNHLIPF